MPRKLFRYILYVYVFIAYSYSISGSYDDYFSAIHRDDVDLITNLLRRGFDPNTPNPEGENGLFLSIRASSMKVAFVLLQWPGTQIDSRTLNDESPLMLAALKGLTSLCQELISKGADVNKPGWAPLHYAATNGHLAVIALLIESNAYIDAESPNGTTPLMMAAKYASSALVKQLLEEGADPALRNQLGLSAVDFANQAHRADVAKMIQRVIDDTPTPPPLEQGTNAGQ